MIFGIGTDICQLDRIEKLLKSDKREAFLSKTFTAQELEALPSAKREVSYFAGRWAAKEALAKSLGSGFGENCRWLDISIIRLASGAPSVVLTGKTAETAENLGIAHFHLSISHEKKYAIAFVVAEKEINFIKKI